MGKQSIVLRALEALKKACKDLQGGGGGGEEEDGGGGGGVDPCNSPSMKALLELQTEAEDLFYGDPNLSTLSHLLSHLRTLASTYSSSLGGGEEEEYWSWNPVFSFLTSLLPILHRRGGSRKGREISKVAGSIESEIQSWIDRESLDRLTSALRFGGADDEEDIENLLLALESRLGRGFDRGFQAALLRSSAFETVEAALADAGMSKQVKERCAAAVAAMVRFNRDVFVGPVLMGRSVRLLLEMGTAGSIRAVRSLVAEIKTPLVDEIEANGEIPRIVGLLEADEVGVAVAEVVMDMAYYGRRETVEEMVEWGVIGRLVALQRSELGGTLIEEEEEEEEKGVKVGGVENGRKRRRGRRRPLASCVARFAIQVEVGEGLRRKEKMDFKMEILRRVREAVITDAEAAAIIAEVLWGSTP